MATKIKDGLFIGDSEASRDPEFIELNKITFVVNCAGRQLPNLWEEHGLHYLTFPWTSDPECVLFDGGNVVIKQVTTFVDEALEKGDSVLVHCVEGTGRCIACVAAYLMFRHRWGFEKALDFLCSKRPDAAPNAGFVQQLYHLDLRLYEKWFGQNKDPPQEELLRHDQWIPLVPDVAPRQQLHQRVQGRTVGRSEYISTDPREKRALASVIADATAGRFGGAASTFPSLGQLTEVQEEELVLVHSFLNSQPQIDALPPGRANYEDHVSKELHWIDRPRVDKLIAAGRLGRKDRRHNVVPVSPTTGHAVLERPGNSSYNALSRGTSSSISAQFLPIGILKVDKKGLRRASDGRHSKTTSAALECEAQGLGIIASGDSAVEVVRAAGGGGGPLASSRRTGVTKPEDEVVVEDLSEPQPDIWSASANGGDRVEAEAPKHENAGGGNLPGVCKERGSRQSQDVTDDSSGEDEGTGTLHPAGRSRLEDKQDSTMSVAKNMYLPAATPSRSNNDRTSLGRGQEGRELVAPGRRDERQAWEGGSGAETVVNETGGHDGPRINDHGSEIVNKHAKANRSVTTRTPPRTSATPGSNQPRKSGAILGQNTMTSSTTTRWEGHGGAGGIGERRPGDTLKVQAGNRHVGGLDAGGRAAAAPGVATVASMRPNMRRRGSEGSLMISTTDMSTTARPTQDKTRFPQAAVGRAGNHGEANRFDSPGPGWGPGDTRDDDPAFNGQLRARAEGAGLAGDGADGKGQGGWGRKGPVPTLYSGGECGGSLQQLAQTPNPQQRRLPSPRLQQEPHQGEGRQRTSESGHLSPHKRPSSAPLQRPDASTTDGGGSDALEIGRSAGDLADSLLSEGVIAAPTSSCGATANQGYPVHGFMLAGSTTQVNDHHHGRRGQGTSGNVLHPRPLSTPGVPMGGQGGVGDGRNESSGTGGGSQRDAAVAFSAPGGGSCSSTESLRLARMPPGVALETEPRGINAPRPGRNRGNSGVPFPREIRAAQRTVASKEAPRARYVGPFASPTSESSVGGSDTDAARRRRGRRGHGDNGNTVASRSKNGLMLPNTSSLPLPSRKGATTSGGDGDGGDNGSAAVRWANPAPRGRPGGASGSAEANSYPGSIDSRGSSGGESSVFTRANKRPAEAYSPALSHRPHVSNGSGPRSGRAGGAPVYRSGSPAPARRKAVTSAAAATGAAEAFDPSHFLHQQRTHGVHASQQQGSGTSPGFRGYIAPASGGGGGADGVERRRSPMPSPTSTDRGRRVRGHDVGRQEAAPATTGSMLGTMPLSSSSAERYHGQRPSTSDGLTGGGVGGGGGGGGGGGRRGRSSSPAPRPSSASGRRRSASPSPASLLGASVGRTAGRIAMSIDPSFDRPRWK